MSIGGQRPMFGAAVPQYAPFGQTSGLPAIAMQLLMPLLEQQMRGRGMVPGQFQPFQNLFDQQRGRQYYLQQQQVMQDAAQLDRLTYTEFFTGGKSVSARRQAQIDKTTEMMAGLAPMLSQLDPTMFDAAHGSRGSALVLAQALHRGGQSAVDPFTGLVGRSTDTTEIMTREIFDRLYGTEANLADMKGVGAGSAGMLLEELQYRGIAGTGIGALSDRDKLQMLANADSMDLAGRLGVHSSEVRKQSNEARRQLASGTVDMTKFDQTLLGGSLASFDSDRAVAKLKEMSGAVAAMKDIFGDAGNPNAAFPELVAAIEQLTQNGMTNMTPEQVERSIRKTEALIKNTGMSLEVMQGLTAAAAAQADELGMDRGFATQAVQDAAAFGGAAGSAARLDMPIYGSLDREKMTAFDQRLRMSAAASPIANRMNAILRLTSEGAAGGRAAEIAKAIREGNVEEAYKYTKDDAAFLQLMQESGVENNLANASLRAKHLNQQYGLETNTGDLVRQLQGRVDVAPVVKSIFGNTAAQALAGQNLTNEQRRAIVDAVGTASQQTFTGMKPEEYRDVATRNRLLTEANTRALKASLAAQGIAMTDEQIADMARDISIVGYGAVDQQFHTDRRFGGMGAVGAHQMFDPTVLRAKAQQMRQAEQDAAARTAMAGVGVDSPFVRFVDAVRGGSDIDKTVLSTLGGMDAKEHAKVDPLLRALGDDTRIMQTNAVGSAAHTDAQRRIAAMRAGGTAAQQELAKIATDLGLGDVSNLSEQAIRSKIGDKSEADRVFRRVTALGQSISVGGIDNYSQQLGLTEPKKLLPEAPARTTEPKKLLPEAPARTTEPPRETPLPADPARDKAAATPGRKPFERDGDGSSKITLQGSLELKNLKEVLLAAQGNSGDMFTGGGIAGAT